jgi:uncharacterized protein YcfJ
MKKTLIALAAAASLALPVAQADAASSHWNRGHGYSQNDRNWNNGYRYNQMYDRYGRYNQPRRITSRDHVWRGNDGRYYCQRDNGTTGLIIGAAGGALLGRAIDEHGDRTLGTVIGGILGGLLGQQIDKSDARCQ